MTHKRDINDIDDDEEGLVDYSGDSDDDSKSKENLPEEAFLRRPAPDLGVVDTFLPHQYSILIEGDEFLGRSNQVFRSETTLPVEVELPKASTHLKVLEKLQKLFPEMAEGVYWDLKATSEMSWTSWRASVFLS
jgi:hypothetical protein